VEPADLSLVETSDGLQVLFGGKALYDERPAATAAHKADSLPTQSQTLYLLPSPAAWHGVAEFQHRLPEDSAILAVESNPILLELSRRLMPRELSHAGVMLSGADGLSIQNTLTAGRLGQFRRVKEITFCRGALLDRPRYRQIREELEQNIRTSWQNRLTLSAMGRLWISNVIRNLPGVASGARIAVQSGPVVVCGAGPSLVSALPLLEAQRHAVTILAVDTALPSLVQRGITPDVVIAVEGQLANVYDFLPVSARDYTLVADISSSPAVIEQHQPHRVAWVSSQFAEIPLLERIAAAGLPVTSIPPLGSVGVAAVQIAMGLSSGPLLLTGLDFAFRPGQPARELSGTHAPGSPFHLRQLLTGRRLGTSAPADLAGKWMEQSGVDGGPVRTTITMVGYAEQLAALVAADARTQPVRQIVAVAPFGLDTGATTVSPEGAAAIITAAAPGGAGVSDDAVPARDESTDTITERIRGLLENELLLLTGLEARTEAALAGEDDAAALGQAFDLCSYVAVDFPDFTGTIQTHRAFLTRVRVAIDFYRERLERAIRYLRS
jgi:6-hydroxymethylpterin diphosphokinase MptE-like protein